MKNEPANPLDLFADGCCVLHQGDVRAVLAGLPAGSVQCVVTSPPYWGLRDYGIEPGVWPAASAERGARNAECRHEWGAGGPGRKRDNQHVSEAPGAKGGGLKASAANQTTSSTGAFCRLCGAWRGCLGLEPTPALYVEHLVAVLREVRRVLRDDGTLWLNLGDTYAAARPMPGRTDYQRMYADAGALAKKRVCAEKQSRCKICGRMTRWNGMAWECTHGPKGYKPKDLCEIPSDVVRALRADGWWLRSRIPWLKRNAMPESTTDRPTSAVEYLFLLTPGPRCFYDGEAVKVDASLKTKCPSQPSRGFKTQANAIHPEVSGHGWADADQPYRPNSRARRNSDWFFESWQGLYDEGDGPLALIVNPAAYKGAHFATFPPKLVDPCIRAGTSEKGCCPTCGAPWERVVERKPVGDWNACRDERLRRGHNASDGLSGDNFYREWVQPSTLGWRPTCDCPAADPVPCLVLDPFAGSGTTLAVALQLGRRAVGIDVKAEYLALAVERIKWAVAPATAVLEREDAAPLFTAQEAP